MKVRTAFVSNSSSSSFLFLCFAKEDIKVEPQAPEYYTIHNNHIRTLDDNEFGFRYGYVLKGIDRCDWEKVCWTSEEFAARMLDAARAFTACGWEIKKDAKPQVYFSIENT